jgi:hypothetical protein
MAHYLDPKNDLVFKRVFGEHPDLLVSFLNALLPLAEGQIKKGDDYYCCNYSADSRPNNCHPQRTKVALNLTCVIFSV